MVGVLGETGSMVWDLEGAGFMGGQRKEYNKAAIVGTYTRAENYHDTNAGAYFCFTLQATTP